jgi:biotin carboxyl carrier protein
VQVVAEIAGTIWKVEVSVGQTVAADDVVVIIESMKMELPAYAPIAGVVSEVNVAEGAQVAAGDPLVVIT